MKPDQETTIKSWVEERDALIAELVPLRSEKEALLRANVELGQAHSDLLKSIQTSEGVLSVLKKNEIERATLISQELAALMNQKAELEPVVFSLTKEVAKLQEEKDSIEKSLNNLVPVYERVTWQINQLTNTVERVVTLTNKNVDEVNIIISNLKSILKKDN